MALREIRKLQKTTTQLISKLPFERLVREIAQDRISDVRFQAGAIQVLQHTAKEMIVELFEEAQRAGLHAKCVTIMPEDIKPATQMLRGTVEFLVALEFISVEHRDYYKIN